MATCSALTREQRRSSTQRPHGARPQPPGPNRAGRGGHRGCAQAAGRGADAPSHSQRHVRRGSEGRRAAPGPPGRGGGGTRGEEGGGAPGPERAGCSGMWGRSLRGAEADWTTCGGEDLPGRERPRIRRRARGRGLVIDPEARMGLANEGRRIAGRLEKGAGPLPGLGAKVPSRQDPCGQSCTAGEGVRRPQAGPPCWPSHCRTS